MKVRVRTTKQGDMRPRLFEVPHEVAIARGAQLSSWVDKCVHTYRREALQTAADIVEEEGDDSPITTFLKTARISARAHSLCHAQATNGEQQ